MKEQKFKVVFSESLSEEAQGWISEHVDLVHQPYDDVAGLNAQLADADGLIVRTYTQVNRQLLEAGPGLKVVGRAGVGLDNIDLQACKNRGVQVVYTPAANTQAVVEYVFALMFDVVRPRVYMDGYVAPPTFHSQRKQYVGRQLDGLVLGVLGMGRIGRRVAEVAHAFGMRVLYNDLLTHRELGLPDDEPSEFVDKRTLWAESDILTVHVDGRAENRHLINAEVLGQLKPDCVFINAARGMVVDCYALADWAGRVKGRGGCAYLDVHDPEPPADDYPLFGIENVKLLPHLASRTYTGLANMNLVVRDVVKVLNNQQPDWPAF